jgi:hypothetical protein
MSGAERYSDDEDGQPHWKVRTVEAHSEAWELLSVLRARGYDRHDCLNVPPQVRELEALVFQYRGCIQMKMPASTDTAVEPFEDWDEELMAVPVPKAATYDGGTSNVFGEFDRSRLFEDLEWTTREVNLATLDEKWAMQDTITVSVEVDNGTKTISHQFRPTLPIAASAACLRQIDRVVEDIGWVPPAREKAIHAEVLE